MTTQLDKLMRCHVKRVQVQCQAVPCQAVPCQAGAGDAVSGGCRGAARTGNKGAVTPACAACLGHLQVIKKG